MSLYEFLRLDELDQLEMFWDGVYIGERRDGGFVIECRKVEDFYVEYTIIGGHYIHIYGFRNPDLLQPYFDKMGRIEI
jgi:hypothetical protein